MFISKKQKKDKIRIDKNINVWLPGFPGLSIPIKVKNSKILVTQFHNINPPNMATNTIANVWKKV